MVTTIDPLPSRPAAAVELQHLWGRRRRLRHAAGDEQINPTAPSVLSAAGPEREGGWPRPASPRLPPPGLTRTPARRCQRQRNCQCCGGQSSELVANARLSFTLGGGAAAGDGSGRGPVVVSVVSRQPPVQAEIKYNVYLIRKKSSYFSHSSESFDPQVDTFYV